MKRLFTLYFTIFFFASITLLTVTTLFLSPSVGYADEISSFPTITGTPEREVFVRTPNEDRIPTVIYQFTPRYDVLAVDSSITLEDLSITMWPGGHTLITHKPAPQTGLFLIMGILPWEFDTSDIIPLRMSSSNTKIPELPPIVDTPTIPEIPPIPPTLPKPIDKGPKVGISQELQNALDVWEQDILLLAQRNGQEFQDHVNQNTIYNISSYWDAQRVFEMLGRYTSDPIWYQYSDAAQEVYAHRYVQENGYLVNAYLIHTDGLALKYERTGDQRAKDIILGLRDTGLYVRSDTPVEWLDSFNRSREAANALKVYLNSERVGEAPHPRRTELLNTVTSHLNTIATPDSPQTPAIKPFMVALTFEVLMQYYDTVNPQDAELLSNLELALDQMWIKAYDSDGKSMKYFSKVPLDWQETDQGCPIINRFSTYPECLTNYAPDLDLLIAPLYNWMYQKTGNQRHQIRAETLFITGANTRNIYHKQINQRYTFSVPMVIRMKN